MYNITNLSVIFFHQVFCKLIIHVIENKFIRFIPLLIIYAISFIFLKSALFLSVHDELRINWKSLSTTNCVNVFFCSISTIRFFAEMLVFLLCRWNPKWILFNNLEPKSNEIQFKKKSKIKFFSLIN